MIIVGVYILGAYLDNSATTPVCSPAREKMLFALENCWGNPSSFHQKGIEALEELENARQIIADKLSCQKDEIYFTSGGTVSNNIAILGAVKKNRRFGNKIISTSIEHPSVENTFKALEEQGFEVVRISVNEDGVIDMNQLIREIDGKTILISIMLVNNEVGSRQPVHLIKKAVKLANSPAIVHCDAVQGFGKMDVNVKKLQVDMLSISSHKIHGPKGAGALYIKKSLKISSNIYGGGQEKNIVSGTEPMPAILGFAAAVLDFDKDLSKKLSETALMRDAFISKIKKHDDIFINSAENALPYIINLSVSTIPSQVLVNYLSEREIYVSGGSACSKGHRSPVLVNMNLPQSRIDSALRVSLSRYTTKEELDELYVALISAKQTLKKQK